jgi:CheY-like chemotaxis protein
LGNWFRLARSASKGTIMSLGLLLCDDLMFASRITGEARALGLTVKPARSIEQLLEFVRLQAPSCILIDLAFPGLLVPDLIGRLGDLCHSPPRVVAYGSHVDADSLRAARLAGCDPVLPRSKFVEELPRSLAQWLTPVAGERPA